MKDDSKGKVILSLLAGATAGIVAGLLLAPETGDDARTNLRQSASQVGRRPEQKLAKEALAKAAEQPADEASGPTNPNAAVSEDKQAADRLLQGPGHRHAVYGAHPQPGQSRLRRFRRRHPPPAQYVAAKKYFPPSCNPWFSVHVKPLTADLKEGRNY